MKKTYATPTTTVSCDVTRETMGAGPNSVEAGSLRKPISGSVGFHV